MRLGPRPSSDAARPRMPPADLATLSSLLTLPQVLSSPEFARAVGFAQLGGGGDGSWRRAFSIAQRQVPGRVTSQDELRWGFPSELRVWSGAVVQQRLRTPTGPFFKRFFIGIILGLVAEFAFIRPSTRLIMPSFATRGARWMGGKQNVGWKFQHGCSTGGMR